MTKVRVNRGSCDEENVVKLFSVYNTAHNELLVLARDTNSAMSIAYQANHIHYMGFSRKDQIYPHFHEIEKPWKGKFTDCWEAIQNAISRRMEGTVQLDEGFITVGHEAVDK